MGENPNRYRENLLLDTLRGKNMDKKIEVLLEAMTNLVNDTSLPWGEKAGRLSQIAASNDEWETALDEFLGWWEGREEASS
jgi:hypothetical protein